MPAGQDYLYFVANSNQSLSESNFANNVLAEPITVTAAGSSNVPAVSISDASGVFNGSTFSAAATVAGTGTSGASLEGVGLSVSYFAGASINGPALTGAPENAGTYTAVAFFPGSTDYATSSSSVTFSIAQADPFMEVSDGGGHFNGTAYSAVAGVAGVDGNFASSLEGVSPNLTYYAGVNINGPALSAAPAAPGTYTVVATFPGSTDYQGGIAAASFTIRIGLPSIQVSDGGGVFNGGAFSASATISGTVGPAGNSLDGVGLNVTYYDGAGTGGSALSGAPTSAGTYTVVGSFPGSPNYASASSAATFTITPTLPALEINALSGTFTGAAFPAGALAAGVNGSFGASLEGAGVSFTYYTGTNINGTALASAQQASAPTRSSLCSLAASITRAPGGGVVHHQPGHAHRRSQRRCRQLPRHRSRRRRQRRLWCNSRRGQPNAVVFCRVGCGRHCLVGPAGEHGHLHGAGNLPRQHRLRQCQLDGHVTITLSRPRSRSATPAASSMGRLSRPVPLWKARAAA